VSVCPVFVFYENKVFTDGLKKSHFRDRILLMGIVLRRAKWRYLIKKLFHLLIDRDIQAAELTEQAGFSANILTRLRREQYVSMESIEKICLALDCRVDDILEFIPDDKENKK